MKSFVLFLALALLASVALVSCEKSAPVLNDKDKESVNGLVESSSGNATELGVEEKTKTAGEEEVKEPAQALLADQSEPRDFGLSLLAILAVGAVVALPVLGLVLLLLFVPVPSLYFPLGTLPGVNNGVLVTGKMLKSELFNKMSSETGRALRGIVESDHCIQRISCEILKASKGINMDKWIHRMINEIPIGKDFKWKVNRAAQATRNCNIFTCRSITTVLKMFS